MPSDLIDYARELIASAGEEVPRAPPRRIAVRPVRSALYVPANRRDWLRGCHRFAPDAVIADLEDAVLAKDRPEARAIVAGEIESLAQRVGSVWVRVNPEPDEMARDLEAVVCPGLAVVQLSKVHEPAAVLELDRMLSWYEGRNGLARDSIAIHPILETANGLRQAYEIAMCCRRVEYMGGMIAKLGDAARALGWNAPLPSDEIASESIGLRSKVLLDARAAMVCNPLGGVVISLAPDQQELRNLAMSNKKLGYAGMIAIHPSHVAAINEIFSPSAQEIAAAKAMLLAYRASPDRGAIRGPGGEMVDIAQARSAAALLERAGAFGLAGENAAS
jgi:citrate lyase subunit beta/citryl-CoA lyase